MTIIKPVQARVSQTPKFGRLARAAELDGCRVEAAHFEDLFVSQNAQASKIQLQPDLTFVEKSHSLKWLLSGGIIIEAIRWLIDFYKGRTLHEGLLRHGFAEKGKGFHPEKTLTVFYTKDFGDIPLDAFRDQANRWVASKYEAVRHIAQGAARPVNIAAIRYFNSDSRHKRQSDLALPDWMGKTNVKALIHERSWFPSNRATFVCQLQKRY